MVLAGVACLLVSFVFKSRRRTSLRKRSRVLFNSGLGLLALAALFVVMVE